MTFRQANLETHGFPTVDDYIETEHLKARIEAEYGQAYVLGSRFVINSKLRNRHWYIIGGTQYGKSKFLEHLVRQLEAGGLILDGSGGSLYHDVLSYCAKTRRRNVLLLDPAPNPDNPHFVSYNPVKRAGGTYGQMANRIVDATMAAWHEDSSDMKYLTHYLPYLLEIISRSDMTLIEMAEFLRESDISKFILAKVNPDLPCVKAFKSLSTKKGFPAELKPIRHHLQHFLDNPNLQMILGQGEPSIDIPDLIDKGFLILVNLHGWGDTKQVPLILGNMLLNDVMACDPESPFHVFVDEVGYFQSDTLKEFLDTKLKKGLVLHLAHQRFDQLDNDLLDACLNNCRNKVVFNVEPPSDRRELGGYLSSDSEIAQILASQISDLEEQEAIIRIPPLPARNTTIPYVDKSEGDVDEYINWLYSIHRDLYISREEAIKRIRDRRTDLKAQPQHEPTIVQGPWIKPNVVSKLLELDGFSEAPTPEQIVRLLKHGPLLVRTLAWWKFNPNNIRYFDLDTRSAPYTQAYRLINNPKYLDKLWHKFDDKTKVPYTYIYAMGDKELKDHQNVFHEDGCAALFAALFRAGANILTWEKITDVVYKYEFKSKTYSHKYDRLLKFQYLDKEYKFYIEFERTNKSLSTLHDIFRWYDEAYANDQGLHQSIKTVYVAGQDGELDSEGRKLWLLKQSQEFKAHLNLYFTSFTDFLEDPILLLMACSKPVS